MQPLGSSSLVPTIDPGTTRSHPPADPPPIERRVPDRPRTGMGDGDRAFGPRRPMCRTTERRRFMGRGDRPTSDPSVGRCSAAEGGMTVSCHGGGRTKNLSQDVPGENGSSRAAMIIGTASWRSAAGAEGETLPARTGYAGRRTGAPGPNAPNLPKDRQRTHFRGVTVPS
jgi:hypothetical protein